MKKIVSYLAIGLLVQGCVGGGALTKHSQTLRDPIIPDRPSPVLFSRDSAKMTNAVVYTAAWLESHWGMPANITPSRANARDEIWTYKFGLIWKGVVPVVIIPIPLALPVAREQVQFTLRDGNIIDTIQTRRKTIGGAIGFGCGPCGITFGPLSLQGLFE